MSAHIVLDEESAGGVLTPSSLEVMRLYRKSRLVRQLQLRDLPAILLYDPLNIRYATDLSNQQVWCLHNFCRYVLVFADGYTINFEFSGCEHLSERLSTIQEVRNSIGWLFFLSGQNLNSDANAWSAQISGALAERGCQGLLAVDKLEPLGVAALAKRGIEIVDGQNLTESARCIKSAEELLVIRNAIKVAESGLKRMYDASYPGMSEQAIWAELHHENISRGGEWIETRLLTAGPRTNPWFQECSNYACQSGDMLSVDTDMIGPYGYCADLSRSWTIGHTPFTPEQRVLYETALEQIHHNLELLRPGLSFAEFNQRSWRIPEKYLDRRYVVAIHGVGLADEFPIVRLHPDFEESYAGQFEEGMVVTVESLIGEVGGRECVKLETQVHITRSGAVRLDTFPFECM
ncbi:Xaa-Pro peptidase family protein [Burkholderia sp. Ac-20353]|uniref:M24 family metallopeptidase n=1 Tax=Burkholderia sp. Ac-20353 TaxID=2703894 RepID=UPI00197B5FEF|nr:Xaa-Pro peptidase family protein [Burkholderia sp. Ac-20353]MBN3786519.1 aminopeptidase P family protein [Burkholderia sp. Ac-20353]